jgi:hypothetical protein
MKGVELPINVLVIIVIAVIVLLGIIAVYFAGWTPYASSAGVDTIKNDVCRKLVMGHGCDVDPDQIEITNFGGADDLQELCETYYGVASGDVDACKAICGCGGIVTIIGGGGGGDGGDGVPTCESCSFDVWVCDDCDNECDPPFGPPYVYHDTRHCICTPPGCTGGATCSGGVENGGIICNCFSRLNCPS